MKASVVKVSVLAALLGSVAAQPSGQAAPAGSVNVDVDKLTDFTASFRMDSKLLEENLHLPEEMQKDIPDAKVHGSIHADVGGERLKITIHSQDSFPDSGRVLPGLQGTEVAELIFDGPGGSVSYSGSGDARSNSMPPLEGEFCATVHFPKGLLPPGQMIKSQLAQMKPMIEQQLNMMPHADATVDGDQVAIYNSKDVSHEDGPPMYVGVKESDGTPVGAGLVAPADGKWEPVLKFTEWKQGAGEIKTVQCSPDNDSTAFAADPRTAVSMHVFDNLMAILQSTKSLQPIFAAFPAKPSLLFKTSGQNTALEVNAARTQPTASSFSMAAIAAVAGAMGGMIAFFTIAKASSEARRVSLISDDA